MDEFLSKFKVKDIFVGGIAPGSDMSAIINYFQNRLKSEIQIKHPESKSKKSGKKPRGYFVIQNLTSQQVKTLLKNRDPEIEGVTYHLKPYFTGSQLKAYKKYLREKKLYVKGVPPDWGTKELSSFLSNFGKLEEACAIVDLETRKCRGYGFGVFERVEEAKRCRNLKELRVGGAVLWPTRYEDRFIFDDLKPIESTQNFNKNILKEEFVRDNNNLNQNFELMQSRENSKMRYDSLKFKGFQKEFVSGKSKQIAAPTFKLPLSKLFEDPKIRFNLSSVNSKRGTFVVVRNQIIHLEN